MFKNFIRLLALSALLMPETAMARVVTDSIESHVLGADRKYTVILPDSYDQNPDKRYPVLYLLHGMTDTNTAWTEKGNVEGVARLLSRGDQADEMIVVTPDAGGDLRTCWNGYFNMPGWQYETFFFDEFMPWFESNYRVISDRDHRAVAGLSMGGGGATSYAQRHPDLFGSCYAMSALMDIPEQEAVPVDNPDSMFARLTKSVRENSCTGYVENADEATREKLRSVRWYVDCGDDDFLLDRNIEFFHAMRAAGIPLQFRVRDGAHEWEYWHSALYDCLPFVSRGFKK